VVEGRTATSNALVFTVSVAADGNVTLDQIRAVVHADANDPNDAATLASDDLVKLTATITDKDGDHKPATLNIGQNLSFLDDGPTIGPIANSEVTFISSAAGTAGPASLAGALGADGGASPVPYTIVGTSVAGSFPDISVNGLVLLRPILSNNNSILTYWADTGGNNTFGDTGDTAYYRLTLGESGAGSYTFNVLIDPPPAKLTFDLSTLASGQNLWGAAADTSKAEGFVVFANNAKLKSDGTELSGGTINTSQGGGPTTIGISNQMFDPTEGAYITYVTNPVTGGTKDADNISYNGLFQAKEAQAAISQTQGNTPVELTVKAFEISSPVSPDPTLGRDLINGAGTGQVAITSATIIHANGTKDTETAGGPNTSNKISFSGGVVTFTGLVASDIFDWTTTANHDQVLISDSSGKFDIGAFNIIKNQPTPEQNLPFTLQATDGDGDHAQASFNVKIDAVLVS